GHDPKLRRLCREAVLDGAEPGHREHRRPPHGPVRPARPGQQTIADEGTDVLLLHPQRRQHNRGWNVRSAAKHCRPARLRSSPRIVAPKRRNVTRYLKLRPCDTSSKAAEWPQLTTFVPRLNPRRHGIAVELG